MVFVVLLGTLCGLEDVASALAGEHGHEGSHHQHVPGVHWDTCDVPVALGGPTAAAPPQAPTAGVVPAPPSTAPAVALRGRESARADGPGRAPLFLLHASLLI